MRQIASKLVLFCIDSIADASTRGGTPQGVSGPVSLSTSALQAAASVRLKCPSLLNSLRQHGAGWPLAPGPSALGPPLAAHPGSDDLGSPLVTLITPPRPSVGRGGPRDHRPSVGPLVRAAVAVQRPLTPRREHATRTNQRDSAAHKPNPE